MNSFVDESKSEEVDEILDENTDQNVQNIDENVLNTYENVLNTCENVQNGRPPRTRVAPTRLQDCEIIADSEVTERWRLSSLRIASRC